MYDEIGVVKHTSSVGAGLVLLLTFPFPSGFGFVVAVAWADQGSFCNRAMGLGPTSHVLDPVVRDHDSLFKLPHG